MFGEVLRNGVKKFKQNLRENYLKRTKIAMTACQFSKISRGSMPPNPSLAFLDYQSAPKWFCRRNVRSKKKSLCNAKGAGVVCKK